MSNFTIKTNHQTMRDLDNYRFIVPFNSEAEDYLDKYYKTDRIDGDGSPFCEIDYGWLLDRDTIKQLPNINITLYEISDRFLDRDDFFTAFLDGDCEDDDFIPDYENPE